MEIEDFIYLIICMEIMDRLLGLMVRSFKRKFWLLELIDIIGILVGYEDGVLIVSVLKVVLGRRSFFIDFFDVFESF